MVNAPVFNWNAIEVHYWLFYRRGMMEAWGRGIGLIMESCREQELLVPETKVVPPFVNLTIWFKPPSDDDFTSSHNEIHNQSNIITPQDKVFEL